MKRTRLLLCCFTAVSCLFFAACSGGGGMGIKNPFDSTPANVTDTYFAEFPDVPIPKDMSEDTGKRSVSISNGEKIGYSRFSGRIEWQSLLNACAYNMNREGWSPISIFSSSKGLMVFEKGKRVCTISLEDGLTSNAMNVWVTPRMRGFVVPPTMPIAPKPVESNSGDANMSTAPVSGSSSSGSSYSGNSSSGSSGGSSGSSHETSLSK